MSDAVTLLQNVKLAEEAKAQAIATARREAQARVEDARRAAASIAEAVRMRLEEETPRLAAETEAAALKDLEALDAWRRQKSEALRLAAGRNMDAAVEMLRREFLAEWLIETPADGHAAK
jgi:vacuolar-type H+-ATPase subunit H